MIKIIIFSLLISTTLTAQTVNPATPLRFLALGDSYTIGQSVTTNGRWPVQLSDSLTSRGIITDTLTIIATTGWRTDDLLGAISNKDLANKNYNLVSLLIGVNNQYQGRPFSQYQMEFPALLDSAIRYAGGNKSHVFVVSIPDYAYTPFGQQTSNPALISAEIDKYNQYNKKVADSLQVAYFDITPISRQGLLYPSYVASDGLHPSAIQYSEWVRLMLVSIDKQLTGINSVNFNNNLLVKITPNPSTDYFKIEVPNSINQQYNLVEVYSLNGKRILENRFSGSSFGFSLSPFPDGAYVVKITSGQKQFIKKIIKNTN